MMDQYAPMILSLVGICLVILAGLAYSVFAVYMARRALIKGSFWLPVGILFIGPPVMVISWITQRDQPKRLDDQHPVEPGASHTCSVCGRTQRLDRMRQCRQCGRIYCAFPAWESPQSILGNYSARFGGGLLIFLTAFSVLGGLFITIPVAILLFILYKTLPASEAPPNYWSQCGRLDTGVCYICQPIPVATPVRYVSSGSSDSSDSSYRDYEHESSSSQDDDSDHDDRSIGAGWLVDLFK